MIKIKFEKSINVNDLVKYLNEYFNNKFGVKDFKKSGVYSVWIGDNGYVEEIEFIGEKKYLFEENDIIKEYYDGDESNLDMVGSGEVDWNDFSGYYELYGEESSVEYYNVVV
jgi:hypothetical protein